MNTLVVDIGGTNVKIWRSDESEKLKVPSDSELGPKEMVKDIIKQLDGWQYDQVSIGYPGEVTHGLPSAEPYNLGTGWVGFDYTKAFGKPVKVMNDACMQAVGCYEGGRMLYIGLGTSMGTVFMIDGKVVPLALGHLKFLKGESFEHYLSRKGLELYGEKSWKRSVAEAVEVLKPAFIADYVVLGGGNAKKMDDLPEGCRRGSNQMAYIGGVRMWESKGESPGLAVFPGEANTA